MRLTAIIFVLWVLVSGCAPRDTAPARSDTLLATPASADSHKAPTVLPNGLVVDSSRILDTTHAKVLARFTPKQILSIYQAYRPLRRTELTQSQLDSFLTQQKITLTELHAILEEGDRLGWTNTR
jgi:hypothetical protein